MLDLNQENKTPSKFL